MNRIISISYKHKLAHIGSCLTAYPIIQNIYRTKNEDDIFILSNGHAGVALYVVLEEMYGLDAENLLEKHGIHPCMDDKIFCSTGSLGLGLTIAVGAAMADRHRNVFCLISDGECAEGSVWEALSCKEKFSLTNLHVHVNANGYSAYDVVDRVRLKEKLFAFCPNIVFHETSVSGLDAHYHVMTDQEYLKYTNFPETSGL